MFVPRKTRPTIVDFSDKASVFFALLAALTILLAAAVPAKAGELLTSADTSVQSDAQQVAVAPADQTATPAQPQVTSKKIDWNVWGEAIESASTETKLNLTMAGIGQATATNGADDREAQISARVESCYDAANGRLYSDQQSAVIGETGNPAVLEEAKVSYYTQKARNKQFADCTRF